MRYSIITPTICRPSLARLCRSIDSQSQSDWEHLIIVDTPSADISRRQREVINSLPSGEKRLYFYCDRRHNNYGHTCRHRLWEQVKGEYILYVDDDDYLADADVLKSLDSVTQPWAVFPILKYGKQFFHLPPGVGGTGTGMFIHRKEIGRWPDSDAYEADGSFVEELREKFAYEVLQSRPLVVQPTSSCGVFNAENWWGAAMARLVARRLQQQYSQRLRSADRQAQRADVSTDNASAR